MYCTTCKKNITVAAEIRSCQFRRPCPALEHLPSEDDVVEDLGLILAGSAAFASLFTDEPRINGHENPPDPFEPGDGEFGGAGASATWSDNEPQECAAMGADDA